MPQSSNLALPFIEAGQAQKHVTHNEALRVLDALVQLAVAGIADNPPAEPEAGERYIVGASPGGAFAGHANEIASYEDGAWVFRAPKTGWRAWNEDANALFVWTGAAWAELETGGGGSFTPRGAWDSVTSYAIGDLVEHEGYLFISNIDANLDNEPESDPPASTAEWTYFALAGGGGGFDPDNVPYLNINGADPENADTRLAARSNDVLLHAVESGDGGSGDVRLQISKEDSASRTASVFFSRDFSGRAEFGLVESDAFKLKVSGDGESWTEALVADPQSGVVSFPQGISGMREALDAGRTYYVRTDGDDGNDGMSDSAEGAFATLQKAYDTILTVDLNGHAVTIQLGDGTYTDPLLCDRPPLGGNVIINGNESNPENVIVSTTSATAILVAAAFTLTLRNFEIRTTSGNGRGVIADGGGSIVEIGTGMRFGACAAAQIQATNGGLVRQAASYAVAGSATIHLWATMGGIITSTATLTVTVSGTPSFSQFANADRLGVISQFGASYSGAATGARYSVTLNSVIHTFGGGADYFPGNAAGTTATGGQYA